MAYKRKAGRQIARGRKRVYRKRTARSAKLMRVSRGITSKVHSFKRLFTNPSSIIGNAVHNPYVASWTFGLNNVVNATDFSNLYDQYRVLYVVCKYYLKIDPSAQTAATASFPRMYWYRDLDDSAPPSSLNEIRENGKCKIAVMHPNRPVTIAYKPNTLATMYLTALANTYSPKWGQWIDMANTNVPHYGHKWAIDDLTNTNYRVDTEITVYFQCRNPR